MKRMATAMLLVGVCVAGGVTPAFADEAPEGVLGAIVADTAPAQLRGDELVAQVGDVRAEIPVDASEPLTLQSTKGPEISITLPRGGDNDEEPEREGSGALSHDLGDGSHIVPAIRSNGIVQILSVLHDAAAPTYRLQKWVGRRVLGMSATRWTLESTSGMLTAFEPHVGFAVGQ